MERLRWQWTGLIGDLYILISFPCGAVDYPAPFAAENTRTELPGLLPSDSAKSSIELPRRRVVLYTLS